jgi:hypothetical protein
MPKPNLIGMAGWNLIAATFVRPLRIPRIPFGVFYGLISLANNQWFVFLLDKCFTTRNRGISYAYFVLFFRLDSWEAYLNFVGRTTAHKCACRWDQWGVETEWFYLNSSRRGIVCSSTRAGNGMHEALTNPNQVK